jgi:Tfp pilus assembly protein PilF
MIEARFIARAVTFLVLLLLLFGAGMSLEKVTIAFGRSQPENYAALAREAMRKGNNEAAQAIVEKRLSKYFYDFDALYLLAEIQAAKGNVDAAADTIRQVFQRLPGARANQVQSFGVDEPKSYYLLGLYLWQAKHYDEAAEMLRAAIDAGYPVAREQLADYVPETKIAPAQAKAVAQMALKLRELKAFLAAVKMLLSDKKTHVAGELLYAEWMELVDRNVVGADLRLRAALSSSYPDPALALALANLCSRVYRSADAGTTFRQLAHQTTGTKVLGPGLFKLTAGETVDRRGIVLGRNGKAIAEISTGAYKVTRLILNAEGSWALGMYPVLIVRLDGKDATWLYLDGLQPHLFDLPLWPAGAPKDVTIEFDFINDAFEPLSKADRNVTIRDILLF